MGTGFDLHILRLKNYDLGGTLAIDWHYVLAKPSAAPPANPSYARQLFPDLSSLGNFYLIGMYNNIGTIMRFTKNNGQISFKLDLQNVVSSSTYTGANDVQSYDYIVG